MQVAKNTPNRLIKSLFGSFLLILIGLSQAAPAKAQTTDWQIAGKSLPQLLKQEDPPVFITRLNLLPPLNSGVGTYPSMPARQQIPMAYQYDELGFFCKVEVQLEKHIRIPIKIRLGEVQYVERLEGKYP